MSFGWKERPMGNEPLRDLRQRAEDAAYTAVGVGVLGFQQAQVRRRAVQKRLATAGQDARVQAATLTEDARTAVGALSAELKSRVEPVVTRLGEQVEPWVADVRTRVEPVLASFGVAAKRPAAGRDGTAPSTGTPPV